MGGGVRGFAEAVGTWEQLQVLSETVSGPHSNCTSFGFRHPSSNEERWNPTSLGLEICVEALQFGTKQASNEEGREGTEGDVPSCALHD